LSFITLGFIRLGFIIRLRFVFVVVGFPRTVKAGGVDAREEEFLQ
jgi:hypothetical protein